MDTAQKVKPANRLTAVSEYYFSRKCLEVAHMNAALKGNHRSALHRSAQSFSPRLSTHPRHTRTARSDGQLL